MKMVAMRPFVVAAALWLFPQLSAAVEMEMDDYLVGGNDERSVKKESFTVKECLSVVKKVQESGRYTEESIVPVCSDVMGRSSNCDFFAEALSLASSHADFQGKNFCDDMDRAQFCSEIMDKLLESTAVSDLAFGECERAKPQKSIEYCRRIQSMLGLSVKQEDLDTMRACYMMEAYTNQTIPSNNASLNAKDAKLEASDNAPNSRIITGPSKELDNVGKGSGPGHPPKESSLGKGDIVMKPVPFESFGDGGGNMSKPKNIITEPVAQGPAAAAPAAASAAPAAASAAPAAAAPAGPILAQPIPAPVEAKAAALLASSKPKVAASPAKAPAAPKAAAPVAQKVAAPKASETKPAASETKPAAVAAPEIMVAQAIMQNGTLVMTGAPFGRVVVDQSRIEEALRKQAAAQPVVQAAATKTVPAGPPDAKPVAVVAAKPAAAPKQAPTAKQAAAPKTAPAAKAKAGLLITETPKVVSAVAAKPVAQEAAAAVAAPVQQKVQLPATLKEGTPIVVVIAQQPVAKAPVVQAPVKAVAPPAAPVQPAAQAAVKTPAVAAVAPPTTPVQAPVVQAPGATVKATPLVLAVAQPAAQSAVAAPEAKQTAPVAKAAAKVAVAQAPVVKTPAAQPAAKTVAAQAATKTVAAQPEAKVAAAKTPFSAAKVGTSTAPLLAKSAPLAKPGSASAPKNAALHAVSKHNAGLAQANQKVEKKDKKVDEDKYAGFLSKFIAY